MIYAFVTRSVNFLMAQLGLINLKTHTFYGPALTSGAVVIDLGANVGQFTEAISRFFDCQCYALEPIPNLFAQIKESPAIKKFNYAISDTDQPIKLYLSTNAESNSMSEGIAAEHGIAGVCELPAITLESFLNQHQIGDVDLLKIDIEGAEELLFNSTSDATLTKMKQITIEFHDCFPGNMSAETVTKMIHRLEALGFYAMPFSYVLPEFATCDFLFINKRNPIPGHRWLGFQVIKLLLLLERAKSKLRFKSYAAA